MAVNKWNTKGFTNINKLYAKDLNTLNKYCGTGITGGGGGGGGAVVGSQDWDDASPLDNWTPYDTEDTTHDISGHFIVSSAHPQGGDTNHCRQATADVQANVLIHDDKFSSHAEGYVKGWVSNSGSAGTVRDGLVYGGTPDGSNIYSTGALAYLYEDESIGIGYLKADGTRQGLVSDAYVMTHGTYYFLVLSWGDEVGGSTTYTATLYTDDGMGSQLATCNDSIDNTKYTTDGEWGLYVRNTDPEDCDWGYVEAGTGSP